MNYINLTKIVFSSTDEISYEFILIFFNMRKKNIFAKCFLDMSEFRYQFYFNIL